MPDDKASAPVADTESSAKSSLRDGLRVSGRPTRFGVPLSVGRFLETPGIVLRNSEGLQVRTQVDVASRRKEGSIRWLLVDAILPEDASDTWKVQFVSQGTDSGDTADLRLGQCVDTNSTLPTGYELTRLADGGFGLSAFGEELLVANRWLTLLDSRGRVQFPRFHDIAVTTSGPVRTTLTATADFGGRRDFELKVRMNFFANLQLMQFDIAIRNAGRARHRGGCWDLGDPGSLYFRDLSVRLFRTSAPKSVRCDVGDGSPTLVSRKHLKLHQNSSGGAFWSSDNHVNRQGRVPCVFRGYHVQADGVETAGERADPIVAIVGTDVSELAISVPEFWQQFPGTIEVDAEQVRIGLFPAEWGDLHELQGGERKTRSICIELYPQNDDPLRRIRLNSPPPTFADEILSTNLLPGVDRWPIESSRLDRYLDEAVRRRFEQRETSDEYGWRNYGEIHADHEEQHYSGDRPLASHYNNQFDCLRGFLLHWLRTKDVRYWELADPLARHVIDIDIYDTQRDCASYNGGLFWITDHYRHARTATHRTYSRLNREPGKDYGGGPSCEHNYTSGLTLYYCLTGNVDARAAVLGLADWVIAMDDGRRNVLGLVDSGPSGVASATRDPMYHGPGRGAGNSVNTLLDAWSLSEERRYLDFAEVLIRRCIHPAEDIDSHDLLNAEERWSYTVFLWSLAKYLTVKAEADEIDRMYVYGRQSLLHYADWMLRHERSYFDRRDQLEYPTEAWAAQEFRKANVFRLAAAFAEGPVRDKLLAQGLAFADRAWSDLESFPSRTTARAMAIVMTEGLMDACVREHVVTYPVGPDMHDFGAPERFVPQKARVKAALKSPRGILKMGSHFVSRLMRGGAA